MPTNKDFYSRDGKLRGKFFKVLGKSECPCKWTKYPDKYIVEKGVVYTKV